MKRLWLGCAVLASLSGCVSCLDLSTAREYPCTAGSPDAGECPNGYRCGLEGYCHDEAVASDYVCIDDSNCEGGWRCGFDGRCHDASDEGLEVKAPLTLAISRVSPQWVDGAPDDIGLAGPDNQVVGVSALYDGGLKVGNFIAPPDPEYWALGSVGALTFYSGAAPGGSRDVAACSNSQVNAYVQHASGVTNVRNTCGNSCSTYANQGTFADVQGTGRTLDDVWVASLSSNQAWIMSAYDSTRTALNAPGPFNDLVIPRPQNITAKRCLLAATDAGMFVAPIVTYAGAPQYFAKSPSAIGLCLSGATPGTGVCTACDKVGYSTCVGCGDSTVYCPGMLLDGGVPWYPVEVEYSYHPLCTGAYLPETPATKMVRANNAGVLAVLTENSAGQQDLAVYASNASYGTTLIPACRVDFCGDWLPSQPVLLALMSDPTGYECAPCPAGFRISDLSVVGDKDDPLNIKVYALCDEQGGASRQLFTEISKAYASLGSLECRSKVLPVSQASHKGVYSDRVRATHDHPSMTTLVGQHGQVWSGTDPRKLQSVTQDVPPRVVIGGDAGVRMILDDRYALRVPGTGLQPTPMNQLAAGEDPVARVDRERTLAVLRNGRIANIQGDSGYPTWALAGLSASVKTFDEPVHAVEGDLADGGSVVVVSAFDLLLSVELNGAVPEEFPVRELRQRLVPASNSAILSLASMPRSTLDGGYAGLYVLTEGGLFRVLASAENRWSSESIPLPSGSALSVWVDNGRGRVGFDDGHVYSVPGRFLLADALPSGALVADYAFWHGEAYALTSDGLYRLTVSPGEKIGQWVAVAGITQLIPGAQYGLGLDKGRLHSTPDALWLFTEHGAAIEITEGP